MRPIDIRNPPLQAALAALEFHLGELATGASISEAFLALDQVGARTCIRRELARVMAEKLLDSPGVTFTESREDGRLVMSATLVVVLPGAK